MIQTDLKKRVIVLDGGMGTMIQKYQLSESDYRGMMFKNHAHALCGNNDVLVLTRPDVIENIHRAYINAGADVIETCTFNANAVSQAEYGLEKFIVQMNQAAVKTAQKVAQTAEHPVFVAGSVGPTNISLSIASDAEHPENRQIDFDTLANAYTEQIIAMMDAGVDVILIETIFDALNAKAALYAYNQAKEQTGCDVPVMVSASLADCEGRLLSGMSLKAFLNFVLPYHPLSIGLNCGFGVDEMAKFLPILAQNVPDDIALSCYPNAGLPDGDGKYRDDAAKMAQKLAEYVQNGWLNIVGGCCGTTPEHIYAISRAVQSIKTFRKLTEVCQNNEKTMRLCGLEDVSSGSECLVIAERANVTGSKKFKRLIEQKNWDEALDTARSQMKSGAQLIDVCMDDSMLDARASMREFLRRFAAEPWISKHPICIDSSDFEVIRTALRECQGRCLVNSISLKSGEEKFLAQAREIQKLGAAVVVMAFDEQGQASTAQRRIEILTRAVTLLVEKNGFKTSDIAVDPNILAIGTGMPEHASQAVDFIETCRVMRERFSGLQTIGGLSNLSFAFRGRDDVRAAIHHAFMLHANDVLSFVIANPASFKKPQNPELARLADALVMNSSPDALENLLAWMKLNNPQKTEKKSEIDELSSLEPADRLKMAFVQGISKYLEQDIVLLQNSMSSLEIIEGPLMNAMNEVGERFGRGEMFLPQIVKAARMMKQAVACLQIDKTSENASISRKKVLLATVWGDVHDIGKNIVSLVLSCNGYEVIDLGVMVETKRIVAEALENHVDAVGLSGLISPSLGVMVDVAKALNEAGIHVPLIVGGAAANDVHTAVRIAPAYAPGTVCHVADASQVPGVLATLLADETRLENVQKIELHHDEVRRKFEQKDIECIALDEARRNAPKYEFSSVQLSALNVEVEKGIQHFEWSVDELKTRLNYRYLLKTLGFKDDEKRRSILTERMNDICHAAGKNTLVTRANLAFMRAERHQDDIGLVDENGCIVANLYGFRAQQKNLTHLALSDFVPENGGAVGLFALSTSMAGAENLVLAGMDKDEIVLYASALSTALVDAANDLLHETVVLPLGAYICPACGYPIAPDHALKCDILRLTDAQKIGISLTDSMMMSPLASICGFTLVHSEARYFEMGKIADDQWEDYAKRRNLSVADVHKCCGHG